MILKKSIDKFLSVIFIPLIIIHLIFLISTRFTLWPEMLVYPYLLNNHFILYKDLINPYPPTLAILLSFITRVFGYSPEFLRGLTWVFIIFIDISILVIAKTIFKKISKANLSLIFFIFISIPFLVNGLWYDLIQTPFILFSVYYFYEFIKDENKKSLQKSLFLLLVSILIKQQATWLAIWYFLFLFFKYLKTREIPTREIIVPVFVFLLLFLSYSLYSIRNNNFSEFFFWTVIFPFFKASSLPGYTLFPSLKQISIILLLPLLAINVFFNSKKEIRFIWLTGLVLFLFAYPRFDYFHLIPSLSVFAILIPISLPISVKKISIINVIPVASLVLLVVFFIHYYQRNNSTEIRFFERDMLSSASSIKIITQKNVPIYIQNGPDQLLVLAHRLPPKPWAIQFPWYLEIPGMQEKIIKGFKNENQNYIVSKPYNHEGDLELGSYQPKLLTDYIDNNYHNYYKISDTLWLKTKN